MIRLTFNAKQWETALSRLERRGPSEIRALNRAAASARTAMSRSISQDMRLKVGTVRDRIQLTQARPGSPEAELSASLKRIPLIEFGAKGPEPSRGRGRGVTAKTPAGRYPHAFIATLASGHRGVFERRGRSRLPIRELFGPSIGRVFEKYREVGAARALEQFKKNLESELRFELQQIKRALAA